MKLFHVSEEPDIKIFHPRPSPSAFENLDKDVVFAISDNLLHNYLLPRDCPRVTYYCSYKTSAEDIEKFFNNSEAKFIVNVEEKWRDRIESTILYLYEMPVDGFTALDENVGYYISYNSAKPLSVLKIEKVSAEFSKRNAELRFIHNLWDLNESVVNSTLNYSAIRLRNAISKKFLNA